MPDNHGILFSTPLAPIHGIRSKASLSIKASFGIYIPLGTGTEGGNCSRLTGGEHGSHTVVARQMVCGMLPLALNLEHISKNLNSGEMPGQSASLHFKRKGYTRWTFFVFSGGGGGSVVCGLVVVWRKQF